MAERHGRLGALGFSFTMFSMAACLPLFFLGPMAYSMGLSLWEALLAALLGNAVTAIAFTLVGRYGVYTGKGFNSQAETVFGKAAKLMIILRGLVGALWFGVEAYNGALALTMIALLALGVQGRALVDTATPLIPLALAAYLATMYAVARRGAVSMGIAASLAGPLLLAYFTWLALWLATKPSVSLIASKPGVGFLSIEFMVYLAIQTNWWATVAVNASDLTRTARSVRSVAIGAFLGLVGGQVLGTYLGYELAAVTGKVLPQDIIASYAPGWAAVALGLLFAFLAPWTTDLTANLPALINIMDSVVGLEWRKAAMAAVAAGFLLAPWWALTSAQDIVGYVTTFASSYGVLLGPMIGPLLLHKGGEPRVCESLTAFAAGIAVSYAASIVTGALTVLAAGPLILTFPSGPAWYAGVAGSLATYILLTRTCKRP